MRACKTISYETQRWWKEADPCRQPLSDAVLKGRIWFHAEEVYHE